MNTYRDRDLSGQRKCNVATTTQSGIQLLPNLCGSEKYCSAPPDMAFDYPRGWSFPSDQTLKDRISKLFPGIDLHMSTAMLTRVRSVADSDGIAIVPKITYLADLWGIDDPYANGYRADRPGSPLSFWPTAELPQLPRWISRQRPYPLVSPSKISSPSD